jgi:cytochrome b561
MAGAWLGGHPLTLLGSTTFGPLLSQQPELGEAVSELHETLGNAIIWLAGLHAAAALVHHFVLRDRVLGSMLPGGALSAAGRATLQKEA